MNPTVTINDGMNTVGNRCLIDDRAICAQAQEHVPAAESIRTLRAMLNTLGDGFVEAIERHQGEAREVTHKFKALTTTQQQQIIAFLNSL